jgi:SAM-dependent methyltransferase
MRQVLHVGCGQATIKKMPDGFQDGSWQEIRFDINPGVGPDIVGTITDMTGVQDGSVDAVYSSHNIEHVYAHEVRGVLREFRRVLKPEGFAVVTCPDAQAVAAHVAEGRLEDPLYVSPSGPISALDILYGHGAAIAGGEVYMAHRTAFTGLTLAGALRDSGFAMIGMRRRPPQLDLWTIGTKASCNEAAMHDLMARYCRS